MRSKEVDLVEIKRYVEIFKEKAKRYDESIEIKGVSVGEEMRIIEAVLAYIEEKEKENKFLRDENNIYKNETVGKKRIRDEIKLYELEIETLKTLYPKTYTTESDYLIYLIKIQVLKNILEK